MSSVTFSPSVGGDGSTVTDDANPTTGLDGGGHRTRFVPALAQTVAVASTVVANASAAAGSLAQAQGAAAAAQTSATTASTAATTATTKASEASASAATAVSAASTTAASVSATLTAAVAASATTATNAATSATASATAAANSAASAAAVALGVSTGYPTIRPSLNLDFANSKTVDPRITFTRASIAAYYDGKTFAKAEENFHLSSQSMTAWTASQMGVTDNSIAAPDGTTTAALLVPTASPVRHYIFRNSSTVFTESGATVTASIFAKAGTYGFCYVQVNNNTSGGGVRFTRSIDLSSGTVGGFSSDSNISGQSITVTSVGGGWYRIVMTCTATVAGGGGGWNIIIGPMPNNGAGFTNGEDFLPTYAADGTSGAYFWGAQLEQRSTVTAYTPTTTQPITRYIPQLLTAASNAPRIDHDPVTGVCKGLLIEEPRTNLLTYSEFGAGLTGAVGLITESSMFSPSGANAVAAAFGRDGSTTSYHYVGSVPASTACTISVYVKMDDGNAPVFGDVSASGALNDFALVVGGAGLVPTAVQSVGNSTYRVSATTTTGISNLGNNGVVKYASNSSRTFKTTAWQLEVGAFPTSYIPTTTAAATRAAELASMTGTNFSTWYRQDEGTFFIENNYNSGSNLGAPNRVALVTYGSADRTLIYNSSYANRYYGEVAGSLTWSVAGATHSSDFVKTAAAYKFNDIAASSNGAVVATDASATLPRNQDRLSIGSTGTSVYLSGYIKRIAYYPKRLSNAELQTITVA